ncbi:hypothetical protein CEXT_541461 [Caerostris extrusa]|uniref:Uncharacterized protein n=1 Tax=Caerostris extrusa TaxID=172846 RepID=A0AAV4UN07_CAEEX|nr:hypothetical protein CEXT_541461 [Caerostris extrusa]
MRSPRTSLSRNLSELSPPQLYLLPWTTTARSCPDAFAVSLRSRFPRGAGNPANQTSPYKSAEAASLSLCEGRNKQCISEAFIE